jgi:hypothetical protein
MSCFNTIIGAPSTSNAVTEVETACPLLNIRNRCLTGKFLLKNVSLHYSIIYNSFTGIYFSWCYVKKLLQIFASVAYSLITVCDFIIKTKKQPLHNINYMAISSLIIYMNIKFLNHPSKLLKFISPTIVYNFFSKLYPK